MRSLILLLLLVNYFLNAQNLQIIYEVTYKPLKDSPVFEKELMSLDIKKDKSIFYSYAKIKSDSIYRLINTSNESEKKYLRTIIPSQSFNKIILKNYSDSKNEIFERFNGEFYEYSNIFRNNWIIERSKKEISTYNCTRAKIIYGGRVWYAWFTIDIPIQDGPFLFQGLPGLILQISSEDGDYLITSKSIQIKESDIVVPSKTVKVKTLSKLKEIKKNYIREPSGKSRLEDSIDGISGGSIINGKKYDAQQSYNFLNNELWEWMKRHNNPMDKTDIWVR